MFFFYFPIPRLSIHHHAHRLFNSQPIMFCIAKLNAPLASALRHAICIMLMRAALVITTKHAYMQHMRPHLLRGALVRARGRV